MFGLFFLKRREKNMKLKKKSVVAVLTLSMSMGSVLSMVPVFAETSQQNLALNKTAYVSNEYGSMPRKNLTDKIILNQIYNARYVRLYIDLYTSNDLVFDEQTTVHVGADEYNADKEAYRRFSDDKLKYVQDTGRTARILES